MEEKVGVTKSSNERELKQQFRATTATTMANDISFVEPKFPDGIRVLAVDDSPVCLKIITTLLRKCNYQVTEVNNLAEALTVLEQNTDKFDLVLTNVREKGQINGFKLLEVGIKHGISVVMTSASEDVEIIKKGVCQGADDYLIKPVNLLKIKTIWIHLFRKKFQKIVLSNNIGGVQKPKRKRNVKRTDKGDEKKRIRWVRPLHDKFLEAIDKLGGEEKAAPVKIMEIMGVKDITREKVASHLQKYRKTVMKCNGGVVNQGNKKKLLQQAQNKSSTVAGSEPYSGHVGSTNLSYLPPPRAIAFRGSNNMAPQYPQLNGHWRVNQIVSHQPQQLEVRPNHVFMQQPTLMQIGRQCVGGNYLTHHLLQQHPQQPPQQQQHHPQQPPQQQQHHPQQPPQQQQHHPQQPPQQQQHHPQQPPQQQQHQLQQQPQQQLQQQPQQQQQQQQQPQQQQQQQQQQNPLYYSQFRPLHPDPLNLTGNQLSDEFFNSFENNAAENDMLSDDDELQSILNEFNR